MIELCIFELVRGVGDGMESKMHSGSTSSIIFLFTEDLIIELTMHATTYFEAFPSHIMPLIS